MSSKSQKENITELLDMIRQAEENQEYNIAADLSELQKKYRTLKVREFKQYLAALVKKYDESEYAIAHNALMRRVREGDLAAIRLYHDIRAQGSGGGEEVVIVDDIK